MDFIYTGELSPSCFGLDEEQYAELF